jgi:hypothetical protein
MSYLRLSCCINAFIFYIKCLCHIGCVYVSYVGHIDRRVVHTKPFFHCISSVNIIIIINLNWLISLKRDIDIKKITIFPQNHSFMSIFKTVFLSIFKMFFSRNLSCFNKIYIYVYKFMYIYIYIYTRQIGSSQQEF